MCKYKIQKERANKQKSYQAQQFSLFAGKCCDLLSSCKDSVRASVTVILVPVYKLSSRRAEWIIKV